MMVDTGAEESVLCDWFTKSKDIPLINSTEKGSDSGNNSFGLKVAKVKNLSVGVYKKQIKQIFVIPSNPYFIKFKIGGILSPQQFFSNQGFVIDFPGKKIVYNINELKVLNKYKTLGTFDLTEVSKNIYAIQVSLNNHTSKFYLDTGGRNGAIGKDFYSKTGIKAAKNDSRTGAAKKRKVMKTDKLALKLAELKHLVTFDMEQKKLIAQGKIGSDVLTQYKLFFNKDRSILKLLK